MNEEESRLQHKFGRMTEDEIRAILVSAVKEGIINFTTNQHGKKLYYLK